MADSKVQPEMTGSPLADFFVGMFGQCWKEPSTEGDLQFGMPDKKGKSKDKKEKKSKKEKKEKEGNKEAGKDAAHASSSDAAVEGSAAPPATVAPFKFLIDNSVLQVKSSPGIAFRNSKCDSDKVKTGEPGPAKWGDILEGIDEGDGWLKVGEVYLPMEYKGVPIVTPYAGDGKPIDSGRSPASPLRNTPSSPRTSSKVGAGTPAAKPTPEPAEQAEATTLAAKGLLEPSDAAALEEEMVVKSVQIDFVEGEGAKVAEKVAEEEAKVVDMPTPAASEAWFLKPSVGTWLQPLPKFRAEEALVIPEAKEKCAFALEFEPEVQACQAAQVLEEPNVAAEAEETCAFVFEEPVKQLAPAPEPGPVDMRHLPSVGTWLQMPSPALRESCVAVEQ